MCIMLAYDVRGKCARFTSLSDPEKNVLNYDALKETNCAVTDYGKSKVLACTGAANFKDSMDAALSLIEDGRTRWGASTIEALLRSTDAGIAILPGEGEDKAIWWDGVEATADLTDFLEAVRTTLMKTPPEKFYSAAEELETHLRTVKDGCAGLNLEKVDEEKTNNVV